MNVRIITSALELYAKEAERSRIQAAAHGDDVLAARHIAVQTEAIRLKDVTELCKECMSETCAYNPDGICMFPMVSGREANTDDDGCHDWASNEWEGCGVW